MQACQEILKRLEPVKKSLPQSANWVDIIKKANAEYVDLKASYM